MLRFFANALSATLKGWGSGVEWMRPSTESVPRSRTIVSIQDAPGENISNRYRIANPSLIEYFHPMTLAANPPIEIPLERMSLANKLELKKALDRDLETIVQESASGPQEWHFKVLAERERRLESGEARFMPLEEFIAEMRRTMP
ncbi:MAG TPA: addiction module protein [Prosthecobacter sp.]